MRKSRFILLFTLLFFFQSTIIPVSYPLLTQNVYAEESLTDTEAPSAPSNLVLVSKTSTTIEISWTGSIDNAGTVAYDVYKDSVKAATTNDTTFIDQNLMPDTTYNYYVIAKDAAGNQSEASNILEVITDAADDTETPTVPVNVVIISKTDTSVSLQWDASTDNVGVTGYEIYNNAVLIGQTDVTSYLAEGLTPGVDFSIAVKAKDAAGNLSEASNELTGKTLLSAPANIIANPTTMKVILIWEPVNGASSYEIEIDGVKTDIGNNVSYTHEGLISETEHTYRVSAKNSNNETGMWSSEVKAMTTKLSVPDNLQTQQTFTSITVSWNSVDEAEEYEIEADGILISNMLETRYLHEGLAPNTQHTYRVRAKNSGGKSDWTNLITVKSTSYGTGTIDDPYIITTVEKLLTVKNNVAAHYKLGNDIDLNGAVWEPIGSSAAPFTGTFDGNGYTVSTFTINKPTVDNVGFFGYINNAVVKNLTLSNINVTGNQYTGSLAGQSAGTSAIQNCCIRGISTINGASCVGGMIGMAAGTVDGCSTEENVSLTGTGNYCGGLIGYCRANISKSYAAGNVTSSGFYTGGLIGVVNVGNVTECYSTGDVSGGAYIGGLIGQYSVSEGVVGNCFAMGSVIAPTSNFAGGLIGSFSSGTVRYCYSTGFINSTGSSVGGLIGLQMGTVTSSYFDSTVTGKTTPTTQARTTSELQQQATYDSWDFVSTWNIVEGQSYPTLRNAASTVYIPIPTGLKLVSATDNSIEVSWQNVSEALSYDVEADGTVVNVGLDTQFLHSSLLPGTNHIYRVRQNSALGQSSWSLPLSISTLLPVPQNIVAVPDITSIVLSWDSISGAQYEIEKDGTIVDNGMLTTYTHNDLLPNTEHQYRVRAKTESTVSPWSEAITVSTLFETYPYPKNLRAVPEETAVLLQWDTSEGAVSYELSVDGVSINTTETSYNHTGLIQNTQHEYKIKAIYTEGSSAWSPTIRVATLPDMSGSGTAADPYIIKSVDALGKVKDDLTACYKLANDLDLQNDEWTPIGTSITMLFTGVFDGDGYTISNLKINKSTTDNIGLFGCTNNAEIKNLGINNVSITGKSNVGSLVGWAAGTTNIQNCTVTGTGTVTGSSNVGGLTGKMSGAIDSCSSAVNTTISGTGSAIGGLVGYCSGGTIVKSYAAGNVTSGGSCAGGLIGDIYTASASVSQCYATGDVSGTFNIGGLIGRNYYAGIMVSNCFSLGRVTGSSYTGGLIGRINNPSITNCYSAGVINATGSYVGGLIGYVGTTTVSSSYYDGVASGSIPGRAVDTSRLTTGMKYKATFNGWDFTEIWTIDEGSSYPYLSNIDKPSGVSEGLPVNDVAGGKGTVAEPYLISTKEQMNNVKYDLAGCYKLVNDIDLENQEWTVIGASSTAPFTGVFDGDGYTISNLTINKSTTDNIGLFGCTNNAEIKNLGINNVSITGKSNVGSLIGWAWGTTNIQNCTVTGTGTVTGSSYAGGLVGKMTGTINSCSSTVDTTSSGTGSYVGGLVGCYNGGTIVKSYAAGNVTSGGGCAGGLIGDMYTAGTSVSQCYATGDVSGTSQIGGLIGRVYVAGVTVSNCSSLGRVTAASYAGGLIGYTNNPSITNCYSAGVVNATGSYVGGLIGRIGSTTVSNSYFDSTTTGRTTPTAQARTTAQLMQQATFTGWDFTSIWGINEGTSYPYLKLLTSPMTVTVTGITQDSISLSWSTVSGATEYEIEIDGQIQSNGTDTTFTHGNLAAGSEHKYRVRSKNTNETSPWSGYVTVVTLIPAPQNVSLAVSDTTMTLTWDEAAGASGYDVEVDGTVVSAGTQTTYIHNVTMPDIQHVYRVRVRTEKAVSAWSNVVNGINWSPSSPGVCLAQTNWVFEADQSIEVVIKANHLTNLYTAYFELQFDTQVLEPDTQSIENLLWTADPNVYIKYTVNWETGKVKIIVTQTGTTQGSDGLLDIVKLNFRIRTQNPSQVSMPLCMLVQPTGDYITVPSVQALPVRLLSR